MTYQKLTFHASSGTIIGNLGETKLLSLHRPAHGSIPPPPGKYMILPPIDDPIYGLVARMVFLSTAGERRQLCEPLEHVQTPAPPPGEPVPVPYPNELRVLDRKGVFVLSSKPVLGHNSLVVTTGFADLMEALRASGGAEVTVV